MTKLTTERLEKFVNDIKTDGMCDITDSQVESALIRLLAYERAAKNPVAWIVHMRTGDQFTTDSDFVGLGESTHGIHSTPLYAAPVLPKQPELENKIAQIKRQKALAWLKRVAYENPCMKEVKTCIEVLSAPAQPVVPEQPEPTISFYRDGIIAAAKWVENQRDAYDNEHGQSDPDTGAFEFGNDAQLEYSTTLSEIAEGIRSLHPTSAQPVSEPYKLKDAVEDIRNSGVEIDADKIKAERDTLNSPVIPDGWVMVPQQIFLDASDIESICSQCGDGHKSGYGDFTDGLLWVGDIQCDNGTIMHGLHISSSDYQEEGGLTLAEFKAPVQEPK